MRTQVVSILAISALAAPAGAQSTAFTYQGRLKNGAALASGPHDFQFRLFDASAGGSQIGTTQCANNVPVSEGLFTTTVDFGQQYAGSAPRFLDIQVRTDTGLDCSNTIGFSPIGARQPVLPVPFAAHANAAFALDAPDGSHPGALAVDNAGRVGMGTPSPQAPLHIVTPAGAGILVQGPAAGAANLAWVGFRDSSGAETGFVGDGSGGDSSIYLASDTGDVHLYAGSASVITAKVGGNVGIGTSAPSAKLDVRGDVALGPSGQFRAAAGDQNLRITRGVVCDWGGCTNPPAIIAGSGFAMSHPGPGQFIITFTTPFSAPPAVTATCQDEGFPCCLAFAMTQSVTASGFTLQALKREDGTFFEREVHFIAIGPR